jgi:hypothetical protein
VNLKQLIQEEIAVASLEEIRDQISILKEDYPTIQKTEVSYDPENQLINVWLYLYRPTHYHFQEHWRNIEERIYTIIRIIAGREIRPYIHIR